MFEGCLITKLYNKTLDFGRKYSKKISNINFLSKCLEHKLVPNTFRITNQPYGNNQMYHAKWTSAAKTASLSWIKITISEEEIFTENILKEYKSLICQFGQLIPENLHAYSADLFKFKNDATLLNLERDKTKKFNHLIEKRSYQGDFLEGVKNKKNKRSFTKRQVWTRRQRKFRNKGVCLYFNYSNLEITQSMDKLLNRGLNFSPTPRKVNVTELLIDIDKFIRTHLWKEYFFLNQPPEKKPPIVKNEKTNLPKNHRTPENLKRFLNATTSELLDSKNRNPITNNLSDEEIKALKELTDLQKNRKIVASKN